jgi:hypothetical protein
MRAYVVIESDSEGCSKTMMGGGEHWMAENYIRLDGTHTKNEGLVDEITLRLRMLNAQFRKVRGHNNDQWNDMADALADTGRDEAIPWPQCPWEVITPTGRIAFRKRGMNSDWTLADVRAQLVAETDIAIPGWRDLRVHKNANRYDGAWTDGCYQPQAAGPSVPKVKPAVFGVYNGRSFTQKQPMDVSILSMEQLLDEFNRAVPSIGREVRYFVGDAEVESVLLQPAQPCSVYPVHFKRTDESRASLGSDSASKTGRAEDYNSMGDA